VSKVIALANQKGGTGKTTTTVNLGISLVIQGKKVLLVDADAQGNLTDSLGYQEPDNLPVSFAFVLLLVSRAIWSMLKGSITFNNNKLPPIKSTSTIKILTMRVLNISDKLNILNIHDFKISGLFIVLIAFFITCTLFFILVSISPGFVIQHLYLALSFNVLILSPLCPYALYAESFIFRSL
jgi:hypothetical protein